MICFSLAAKVHLDKFEMKDLHNWPAHHFLSLSCSSQPHISYLSIVYTKLRSTSTVHSDLNCGLHFGLIVYNINLVNAVSQRSNNRNNTHSHTHSYIHSSIRLRNWNGCPIFALSLCVWIVCSFYTQTNKYVLCGVYEMNFANQFSINVTNEVK